MINYLISNIGTICVGTVLAFVLIMIVRGLIKDKKAGKSSCGCGCSSCAMSCSCHKVDVGQR